MIKVENWNGYDIRFIEIDGEWWAILKDICDALGLRVAKISERLDSDMLERVAVEGSYNRPNKYKKNSEVPSKDVSNSDHPSKGVSNSSHTYYMLAVNEIGIYEALFASRKLEARKFRRWSAGVMQKLRRNVGLEGYEVMRMTEPDIQDDIDQLLDTLFYDEETGVLMQSVTVAGGDVDQIPFE